MKSNMQDVEDVGFLVVVEAGEEEAVDVEEFVVVMIMTIMMILMMVKVFLMNSVFII